MAGLLRVTTRKMRVPMGTRFFSSEAGGFYNLSLPALVSGEQRDLSEYAGKVSLVVNVASLWGHTPGQYPQLNKLQETYGPKGFNVLAIPCNQFGLQENSNEDEILPTLEHVRPGGGYKPTFPFFGKVTINGEDAHPVYKFLKDAKEAPAATDSRAWLTSTVPPALSTQMGEGSDVQWNFEKFLVGRDGSVVGRFSHASAPEDLSKDIEAAL